MTGSRDAGYRDLGVILRTLEVASLLLSTSSLLPSLISALHERGVHSPAVSPSLIAGQLITLPDLQLVPHQFLWKKLAFSSNFNWHGVSLPRGGLAWALCLFLSLSFWSRSHAHLWKR